MNNRSAPLAIVVKCWPRLSETFVAQELAALEQRGQQYEIWSLRHPANNKRHPMHDQVKANVHYLPEYLHDELGRLLRSWWRIRRLPGYKAAYQIWWRDFKREPTRNRLRRFGQGCVLAAELPATTRAFYAHFVHTPASVTRYAAIISGLPWSFSAHAKDIWTSPDWEIREKLDPQTFGADFGVTCTASGAEQLRKFSQRADQIDIVYHGLDLTRFPAPPNRGADSRCETSGKHNVGVLRLLSVGRLVEKKGFDRLIDALALLPESLSWHWTHIGGGELKSKLASQAAQLDIEQRITWSGECEQPEVIEHMRNADIFILPSRIAANGDRDGLPNVLMEAASQKLAIISTAISAIPEFIEHDVHGYLSDDSPRNLSDAIDQLANNSDRRAAFAEAAYRRLVEDFGMDNGIDHLNQRLRNLCDVSIN